MTTVSPKNPIIPMRAAPSNTCADCALNPVCLPPAMPDDELFELEELIDRRRPIARGKPLFRQGDPFETVFAVRTGAIKTCITLPDGAEQITGFYLPGELVGLDGIAQQRHVSTAIALESTAVCALPFDQLEALAGQKPPLQRHLFKVLSEEIHSDQQLLLLLGKRSAEARLAAFLISLSSRYKRRRLSENRFSLPMSRTDIGNHLGLAIETVSRLFGRLQQTGVLEMNGRDIAIVDRAALCQLAEPREPEEQEESDNLQNAQQA